MSQVGSGTEGSSRRTRGAVVVVVLLLAAVLAVWLLRPSPDEQRIAWPVPTSMPLLDVPTGCAAAPDGPFMPTSISVPGIVKDADVLALPRDRNDVPSTPPLTAAGKRAFAWDRPPGIEPGAPQGNVLLNAHTFPDGSALGNDLLDKLEKGDRLVVEGHGSRLCYRISKEVEVLASKGYAPYYDRDGAPQIALIVCSGQRLGPGEWTHRTIWFAEPMALS